MKTIDATTAKDRFGITTMHEVMDNGQMRFRLLGSDGSSYVRTVASDKGTWENSHFHKSTRETYIVQKEWMAFAQEANNNLQITLHQQGDSVTTDQFVSHNVYTPSNAILHIVKHGICTSNDWFADEELDTKTKYLSEREIFRIAQKNSSEDIDPKFNSYVTVYNNLDNLLWKMPGVFFAVAAILIGFVSGIVSKGGSLPSSTLFSVIFLFSGILFSSAAYSLSRLRIHHTRMGEALRDLEPSGYFHSRSLTVNRIFPPGAPILFVVFFSLLGISLIVLGILAFKDFSVIEPYLLPRSP